MGSSGREIRLLEAGQEILSNEEVAPGIFRMSISGWNGLKKAHPGQFVHIRCSSLYDPLLRRPFSIHELDADNVKILYRVVGKGTDLLSKRKSGDKVDIIGPLGTGFGIEASQGLVLMVGGGMGVAPLLFLAQVLGNRTKRVLLGARTKEFILCEEEFKKLGCSVQTATDDGSYGEKGYVSLVFKKLLEETQPAQVYACGPNPMLKEIALTSARYQIRCQVSFESQMGCGVGACLGCVVRTKEPDGNLGYRRVCREGPVFDANVVIWESLI